MTEIVWILDEVVMAVHDEQLAENVLTILGIADGSFSEERLAVWIRDNIRELPVSLA